jgi:hypothetical protein
MGRIQSNCKTLILFGGENQGRERLVSRVGVSKIDKDGFHLDGEIESLIMDAGSPVLVF